MVGSAVRSLKQILSVSTALIGFACASGSPTGGSAGTPVAADRSIETTTNWQAQLDATVLRTRYGALDDFAARCQFNRPVHEAFTALQQQKWNEVLGHTAPFLDRCPVDIDFHFMRAIALSGLGRDSEATQHHHWHRSLVESILRSGSGRSADDPWVVISVGEEYALLRALQLQVVSQSLLDGRIDAVVVDDEDERTTVYFDPAAHFARRMK